MNEPLACCEVFGGHICYEPQGHDLPHRCGECDVKWSDPDD